MENDLYAIFNTDLNTWIKVYENDKIRYYLTSKEANEIIKEYRHDKDKNHESIIVLPVNFIIKKTTIHRNLVEEYLKKEADL